jgi:hypothetical protein
MKTEPNVAEAPDYQKLLAERLADPGTARSLLGLLDRIDTVETALSGLEELIRKMPEMLHSVQQEYRDAGRMNEAALLLDKITRPETMRALTGLLDKAETLETVVSALDYITSKAPEMIGSAETESPAPNMFGELMRLAETIAQPEVMRNITVMVENLDTIATMSSALGEMEKRLPELIKSMHEESNLGETIHQYLELAAKLSDDKVIANFNHLLEKIENLDAVLNILDNVVRNNPELKEANSTTIRNINELFTLLTKSMKDEEATILETARGGISILAEVNRILLSPKMEVVVKGLTSAMAYRKEEVPELGPIGMLRLLGDKNTRKTLGLMSLLGHEIGGQLDQLDCTQATEFEMKHKKGTS